MGKKKKVSIETLKACHVTSTFDDMSRRWWAGKSAQLKAKGGRLRPNWVAATRKRNFTGLHLFRQSVGHEYREASREIFLRDSSEVGVVASDRQI
jgi:hypothetical protein